MDTIYNNNNTNQKQVKNIFNVDKVPNDIQNIYKKESENQKQ